MVMVFLAPLVLPLVIGYLFSLKEDVTQHKVWRRCLEVVYTRTDYHLLTFNSQTGDYHVQ